MPAHAPVRANTFADNRLVEGMLLHCPAVKWCHSCIKKLLFLASHFRTRVDAPKKSFTQGFACINETELLFVFV